MSGLPFGAAQTFDVPSELCTYDHVTGIEFVEFDPDLPYPRSSAYRVTPNGGQMRIRRQNPELEEVELSAEEARELIEGLTQAGLFTWQRVYRPVQGTFVNAAREWRLEVSFDRPLHKRASSFKVEGEHAYPDSYEQIVGLLIRSAG